MMRVEACRFAGAALRFARLRVEPEGDGLLISTERTEADGAESRVVYSARTDGVAQAITLPGFTGTLSVMEVTPRLLVAVVMDRGVTIGRIERELSPDGQQLTVHQLLRDGSTVYALYDRIR